VNTNAGNLFFSAQVLSVPFDEIVTTLAFFAYSSSTSVCKNLPVATRQSAVVKIESNKKTYTDYLTNLKQLWDAALARPREDNSALITKINFDLKDKYSQSEIDKVYDAVKKLLQTCIDSRT
jgi:hypothetical protein